MQKIVFIVYFFTSMLAFNQATTFSDSIKVYLDRFRSIALTNPDSCFQSFDTLYQKSIEFNEYHAIAKGYNIIGIGYAYQNRIPEAIKFFLKAENVASKLAPTDIWVDARNNIANMYITQGDTANSLKYFDLALDAAIAYGDEDKILLTQISLASLELDCNKLKDAKTNLDEINSKYDSIKRDDVKAYYHIAMSRYHMLFNDYKEALMHAEKAMIMYQKENDLIGISTSNYFVGINEYHLGKNEAAINHCLTSFNVADSANLGLWQDQSCECLSMAYEKSGNLAKALYYHKKLLELREAIRNDERTRDLTKLQLEVEFTKKRVEDSLRSEQEKLTLLNQQELSIQKEKTKSYILYSGLAFITVIAVLFYVGYKRKQKANQLITEQKNTVEQKQLEIMDSIAYSKRLQNAIFPSDSKLNKLFKEHFILFKPRDIVSGDFYWCEEIKDNNQSIVLFAVADCTGHGVPGAMVSVVCSNALRRTVNELKITEPGKILDKVSDFVIEAFDNSIDEIKDGMDISLIAIVDQNGTKTIYFSGANSTIWLVKNKAAEINAVSHKIEFNQVSNQSFIELSGNRQPVGKYLKKQPFTSSSFVMEQDEIIYLFTDGFHDQFGGYNTNKKPGFNGKKLKYKQFKSKIAELTNLSMLEQKNKLSEFLTNWQGDFEQTDDICVVGIKF